jgi:hypothetical protein
MTSTTTDVFAQANYVVRTTMVDRVDNQGEPCDHCAIEGRFVDATVYGLMADGRMAGLLVTINCCVHCVPVIIASMDPTESVTVELGDSLDDDADNDRMHNQDDTRPHPDAL